MFGLLLVGVVLISAGTGWFIVGPFLGGCKPFTKPGGGRYWPFKG